jgi:hypothetical protein
MNTTSNTTPNTTLVIDIRTNRVIYFTHSTVEDIPTDTRNWVATLPRTDVPTAMTLLNCHSYTLQSGKLHASAPPPAVKKTLEQTNREALTKSLREKMIKLWFDPVPWSIQAQTTERLARYSDFEAHMQGRIALATTPDQVSGLAKEIDSLDL